MSLVSQELRYGIFCYIGMAWESHCYVRRIGDPGPGHHGLGWKFNEEVPGSPGKV